MAAFDPEGTRIPAAIGIINVYLLDSDGTTPGKKATAEIEILDASGNRIGSRRANLNNHLTNAQINGLLNFLTDLRAQAVEEILP